MKKYKKQIFWAMAAVFYFLMCLLVWFKPERTYSDSERRSLTVMPELSAKSIWDGSFMTEFETAGLDQFPFRDALRTLKTAVSVKSDEQGMYLAEGSIVSMEYPLRKESVAYAGSCFFDIYEMYLKDSWCRIYLSVIPDKNYFYAEANGYLSYDYEEMVSLLKAENKYMTYVDIFPDLSKDDYYKTDPHWKQEKLIPAAETLLTAMGQKDIFVYDVVDTESEFYGAYANRIAEKTKADKMSYITNEQIAHYSVFDYEHNQEIPVYDLGKLEGKDAYELYTGGPISLAAIINPMAKSEKELIVFRDSFGSSIAPLLALGYRKTTLVDIRYLQPAVLKNFVEFENQDVLFLYSTLVLNHSETLK